LPNGTIEFLGRIDQQVKIRGFRIEPGEIETVLSHHPAVREAVVVAREDVPGDKRLVAYVVPEQGQEMSLTELRSFLRAKLPEYMVPSTFVRLAALPLTPNGKVDRRALPPPEQARPELGKAYVAPRTPVEETLARIWAEVLGVGQVGIYDNFFELGGHSLQAVKLISKISSAMHGKIPIKYIFLYPTIADFADAFEKNSLAEKVSQQEEGTFLEKRVKSAGLAEISSLQLSFPFLTIERHPLLSLFTAGKLAPVDAASLAYLPDSVLEQKGVNREMIIESLFNNLPLLTSVMATPLGRIAHIFLPRFISELYADEKDLVSTIVKALEIAGRLGARTVALTGLIPSATDYGASILKVTGDRKDLPVVTTGHATTTASIVLSIRKILQKSGRDLARERVGFLGLGSVGVSTLRLMLKTLPHPNEIVLCDVYAKHEFLEKIREEVISDFGFQGPVDVAESNTEVPPDFYDSTFIIGATNVPDILDVKRVRPGTMIVDDSGPHCFVMEHATERFQDREDILFTEGGVLQSPQPLSTLVYLPPLVEQLVNKAAIEALSDRNPHQITGCVLSGLLSSCFADLKPTVGFVDVGASGRHYEKLTQLGFDAADLHCEGYVLPEKSIQNFRKRFGVSRG
jgi:acyl carrier protein